MCVGSGWGGVADPGALSPSRVSFGQALKLQAPGVWHRLPNPVKVALLQAAQEQYTMFSVCV